MASFYRWEKRGPTQRIPLFCVSHFPGGGWAVTQCPEPPPNAQASSTGQTPTPAGEAESIPAARPGAAREVAPRLSSGSGTKFVNSGGRGRARRRTSERRGEEGRGREGGAMDSPEKAKSPEAQKSAPQSAASRRGHGMVWGRGRGTRRSAVQTREIALLLDGNKSGSAAPPTGPRAPPRPARGGLGAGLRGREGLGGPGGPRPPTSVRATPCIPPGASDQAWSSESSEK